MKKVTKVKEVVNVPVKVKRKKLEKRSGIIVKITTRQKSHENAIPKEPRDEFQNVT